MKPVVEHRATSGPVLDWDIGVNSFLKFSRILERILTENIELIFSLDSKLTLVSICSIRIRSGKRIIVEKLVTLT